MEKVLKKLVIGNWKMNGSLWSIKQLCSHLNQIGKLDNVEVIVCVPSIYLDFVSKSINSISIGAQNISEYSNGSYTGEISVTMLKDFGCKYVIIGHSERRMMFHDTDIVVSKKIKQVLDNGLVPIMCVGETSSERNNGELELVLKRQISLALSNISVQNVKELIIAYEPVWAIGSGVSAELHQIDEAHFFIRQVLTKINEKLAKKSFIVYGGSLNYSSAAKIFSLNSVNGGLIGGASLIGEEFCKIVKQTEA